MPRITDIRVVACCPTTENLVLVRVETSEPDLYGWGDATFTQRHSAVVQAIEDYLRPLLIGRDARQTTELWHLMHHNSYWRGGPVLNNAISGIDTALWDIKGKLAGLPVYELIGGKVRPAAAVYRHASGSSAEDVLDNVQAYMDAGVRHVRIQQSGKGKTPARKKNLELKAATAGYGGSGYTGPKPDGALEGAYIDPAAYIEEVDTLIGMARERFGNALEIVHDTHSRLMPPDAIRLAKRLEKHRLFFLEDVLAPEQMAYLPRLRAATTTPLAIGELFTSPEQWVGPVTRHELDFLRMHLSAIGGMTPALRAAQHAAMHDVRTAWHCPKDIAPIGVAMNLHLDVAMPNFGIQEFSAFTDPERAIFTGLPELREGFLYPVDRPGWGIDVNEDAAAKYPASPEIPLWTQVRGPDGSLIRP